MPDDSCTSTQEARRQTIHLCECGAHGVMLDVEEEYGEVFVTPMAHPATRRAGRLRLAWEILRRGRVALDCLVLDPQKARELAGALWNAAADAEGSVVTLAEACKPKEPK